jgi:mutator protein MutT
MNRFVSCAIIFDTESRKVLLQHRTADARINPNKWGFFGGHGEEGETPDEAFVREIKEELNIALQSSDFRPLFSYEHKENGIFRYVYLVTSLNAITPLVISEGQGYAWVPVSEVFSWNITSGSRSDLEKFFSSF